MLGIIMAGGQGSRLMPLTATRPKPMVEVLGRPVIDYVKDAMLAAGLDHIIVTTGYRGEQLERHVGQWNQTSEHGHSVSARINQESTPMGTAGSVGLLRDLITETCVVGSGDAVASFDIGALLEAHRKNGAKVTMALWEVEDPSEFGIVGLAPTPHGSVDGNLREGFIRRFLEKPSPEEAFSSVINAGLYILEPEVFDHIPADEKFDFSKQLFPHLLNLDWPMYAQTIDGVWFDVGHPFELLKAQSTLIEQYDALPFEYSDGYQRLGSIVSASPIHPDSVVEHAVLGVNCDVSKGASVRHSLIMDGCVLHDGSSTDGSVLGRSVVVPSGCNLIRCVVGDHAVLESNRTYQDERIPFES
jgi:mannose-1-phosphate guanylyltransferase